MHTNPDAGDLFGDATSSGQENMPLIATAVATAVTLTVLVTVALSR